jgi:LDH2 family malate/lactate/ureidoglycolate dehydrogenase
LSRDPARLGAGLWVSVSGCRYPGTLLPGNLFAEQMAQLVKAIQATPRRPEVEEIRIPSQRTFRERERRRAKGILVDSAVIAALEAL